MIKLTQLLFSEIKTNDSPIIKHTDSWIVYTRKDDSVNRWKIVVDIIDKQEGKSKLWFYIKTVGQKDKTKFKDSLAKRLINAASSLKKGEGKDKFGNEKTPTWKDCFKKATEENTLSKFIDGDVNLTTL